MVPVGGQDDSELLRLVASAEVDSEHPLATAIVAGAKGRRIELSPLIAAAATALSSISVVVNARLNTFTPSRVAGGGADPQEDAERLQQAGSGAR